MARVNNISPALSEVQRVLGYFPNTVAGVCRYSGINKWAKYKPFRSSALEYPDQKGSFMKVFTVWNVLFLLVLTAEAFLIGRLAG